MTEVEIVVWHHQLDRPEFEHAHAVLCVCALCCRVCVHVCVCARAVLCLCSPRADAGSLSMQVDTLCLEDLHAFIAQALCLQGKPTMELADLQVLIVTTLGMARLTTGALAGTRFDSKHEFTTPTIFLGLLLCPWTWGISSKPLQCLPFYWGFSDLGRRVSLHGQSRVK